MTPRPGRRTYDGGAAGAPLARLELALSLRALARAFPDLRLRDPDADPEYVGGFVIRGLRRLDVVAG